jgi:hypothetical protein
LNREGAKDAKKDGIWIFEMNLFASFAPSRLNFDFGRRQPGRDAHDMVVNLVFGMETRGPATN